MGKLLAHTSDGKIVLHPSPYLRRRGMWRVSKSLIPAPAASRTSGMKAVALVVPCTLRSTSPMKICRCIRDLPMPTSWQTEPRTNRHVGHCRDTLRLGTAGILGGWAPQGCFAVGHIRQALQGYSLAGHSRDTWWLGTAGHCKDTWWLGTARILGGFLLMPGAHVSSAHWRSPRSSQCS